MEAPIRCPAGWAGIAAASRRSSPLPTPPAVTGHDGRELCCFQGREHRRLGPATSFLLAGPGLCLHLDLGPVENLPVRPGQSPTQHTRSCEPHSALLATAEQTWERGLPCPPLHSCAGAPSSHAPVGLCPAVGNAQPPCVLGPDGSSASGLSSSPRLESPICKPAGQRPALGTVHVPFSDTILISHGALPLGEQTREQACPTRGSQATCGPGRL